jgi:uncharacterized protein (TIGR00296 family)
LARLRIERARGEPVRPEELSDEEGAILVRLARRAVESYLEEGNVIEPPGDLPERLWRPGAAFVTIESVEGGKRELRGCIGFPYPIKPLYKAVAEAAVEAAFNDPRFPPLRRGELDSVIFEVTVLTPPEEIRVSNPLEYLKKIVIGRDGLIIEKGPYRGLLLPQVPVEYNWSVEEYLMHLCLKAGLPPNSWMDKDVKIYRFSGRIFAEESPRGAVREERLSCEI